MKSGVVDPRTPAQDASGGRDPQAAKAFDAQTAASPPAADPLIFDTALAAAVKEFQTRHGLDATGVVDRPTLAG